VITWVLKIMKAVAQIDFVNCCLRSVSAGRRILRSGWHELLSNFPIGVRRQCGAVVCYKGENLVSHSSCWFGLGYGKRQFQGFGARGVQQIHLVWLLTGPGQTCREYGLDLWVNSDRLADRRPQTGDLSCHV